MKIAKRLLKTPSQKGFQGWSTTYKFFKKLVKLATFAKQIGVQTVPSPLAIIGTYMKISKKLTHLHMCRSPSQLFKTFSFATLYTSLSCWLILCTSTLLSSSFVKTLEQKHMKTKNTKTLKQKYKNMKTRSSFVLQWANKSTWNSFVFQWAKKSTWNSFVFQWVDKSTWNSLMQN